VLSRESRSQRSSSAGLLTEHGILATGFLAIVAIALFDALTPAGITAGILLTVPIVAMSALDDRRAIYFIVILSLAAFAIAAWLGRQPSQTLSLLPNRTIVAIGIVTSGWVAILLQRRRLDAQQARDTAVDAHETNRLLMGLIAHDLRAPLGTALQTLDILGTPNASPAEVTLIAEVRTRLQRSIRNIEAFLSITRKDESSESGDAANLTTTAQLATLLEEEFRAFGREGSLRGKPLHASFELPDGVWNLNVLVLRYTISILLDNAIRHAAPGPIEVRGTVRSGELAITVEDSGPGLSVPSPNAGAGIGLELCRALLKKSGGNLRVLRDDGQGAIVEMALPIRSLEPDTISVD
jgi:signal transduction histidine kinase